jgi:hypothetical protein
MKRDINFSKNLRKFVKNHKKIRNKLYKKKMMIDFMGIISGRSKYVKTKKISSEASANFEDNSRSAPEFE